MADCPTGILVELYHSPVPEVPTNNFTDFLKTLGIEYTNGLPNNLLSASWNTSTKEQLASPSTLEDDLITSEVFDFKVPSLEELDLPALEKAEPTLTSLDLHFQFPILSTNASTTADNLNWDVEVCIEAQKVSKRLSLAPLPFHDEDGISLIASTTESQSSVDSDNKTYTILTESQSSVDSDNRTYTILSSVTSSDGENAVFSSPSTKNSVFSEVSEDKENNPRMDKESPIFVPNKNAEEALTPQGCQKIRGPLLRRGTYTVDKNFSTPKASHKLMTSGTRYSQGSVALKKKSILPQDTKTCSTQSRYSIGSAALKTRQTTNQDVGKITNLTPKMIPRSKSFMRIPQASPKISSFRLESPQVNPNRRSISLDRTQVTRNTTGQLGPLKPLTSKVGGPSPLLRTALVPKPTARPTGSTLTGSTNPTKGPMKAPPLRPSSQFQQFSRSGLPAYGSNVSTGQSRNTFVTKK